MVFSFNMTPKNRHHIKALHCSRERPVWVLAKTTRDEDEGLFMPLCEQK